MPEWISVKDRLPENHCRVLCNIENWSGRRSAILLYDGAYFRERDNNIWVVRPDVSHWMPLPEPPKEDK